MRAPNRFRDVRDTLLAPGEQPPSPASRVPVNRDEARLFFRQSWEKADETEKILDALGRGYKISLDGVSDYVKNLVRILDPESGGEHLSWEAYKKAVDMTIASSFPDMLKFERNVSSDPFMNHQILETLINEQTMAL